MAALVVLEGAWDGGGGAGGGFAGLVGGRATGGDGGVGDAGSGEDTFGGAVFFDAHALGDVSMVIFSSSMFWGVGV